MLKTVTDMETWALDFADDRIYRFLVYKRMFTPLEQSRQYIDQTEFEENTYRFGLIEEVVDLGNGHWMIGIREILDDEVCEFVNYFRLEDIRLAYFDGDQDMLLEAEEDGEE